MTVVEAWIGKTHYTTNNLPDHTNITDIDIVQYITTNISVNSTATLIQQPHGLIQVNGK